MYERAGASWRPTGKLAAEDGAAGDSFGQASAVSGDVIVVGASLDDDNGTNSGSAYVFVRSGTNWTERRKLTASDAEENDRFGTFVSISGNTVIAGARLNDDDGSNSGAAYIRQLRSE